MATHSSVLTWRIPQTEELDGLQSMGSQRVRQDWATNTIHSQQFLSTPCRPSPLVVNGQTNTMKTATFPAHGRGDKQSWRETSKTLRTLQVMVTCTQAMESGVISTYTIMKASKKRWFLNQTLKEKLALARQMAAWSNSQERILRANALVFQGNWKWSDYGRKGDSIRER